MDKKSKALLILFVIAFIISVSYTFYKTVILQDFEIIESEEQLEYDPSEENFEAINEKIIE